MPIRNEGVKTITIEEVKRVLESMLSTPIALYQPPYDDFQHFEKTHCFAPQLQVANRASFLKKVAHRIKPYQLVEITEPFETRRLMFCLEKTLVIIGPYVTTAWSAERGEQILSKAGAPAAMLLAYQRYICQYSIVDTYYILRAAYTMLDASGCDITQFVHEKVYVDEPENRGEKHLEYQENNTYWEVMERYAVEKELMDCIKNGDEPNALIKLRKMLTPSKALSFTQSSMWTATASAAVLRTIIRIAAAESGLSTIIIDSISTAYAQKMGCLSKKQESGRQHLYLEEMIHCLCKEIQQLHSKNYSAIVKKAICYLQSHLNEQISVSSLAACFRSTPAHLSNCFKAEVGLSIQKYLMAERCKKAAELLVTTTHTVQEISAYVGYLDNNYFTKVFKNEIGMTPSEYRKTVS